MFTFSEDGLRTFQFPVEIVEDDIAEGTERLTVRLSSLPGETGVAFHRDTAQINIIDDDGNNSDKSSHAASSLGFRLQGVN